MQISGFGKVLGYVEKVDIVKRMGEHSHAYFDFLLLKDGVVDEKGLPAVGTAIEIKDDNSGEMYFCGQILRLHLKRNFFKTTLSVVAGDFSYKSDVEKKNRVFQSTDKTYDQITKKLSGQGLTVEWDENIASKEIETMILQRNESDFAFVQGLARRSGLFLFLKDCSKDSATAVIKKCLNKKSISVEADQLVTFDLYLDEKETVLETQLKNKYLKPGEKIRFTSSTDNKKAKNGDDNSYIIMESRIHQENDLVDFSYRAIRENSIKKSDFQEDALEIIPLGLAKVVNNKDPENKGRIQVEFLQVEDCLTSKNKDKKYCWLTYLTPLTEGEGGFVWIPDPEEVVEVYFRKGEAIAVACSRQKTLHKNCIGKENSVDNRVILIRDKQLTISKDYIELIGFQEGEGQLRVLIKDKFIEIDNKVFLSQLTDKACNIKHKKGNTQLVISADTIQGIAAKTAELKAAGTEMKMDEKISLKASGSSAVLDDKLTLKGGSAKASLGSNLTLECGSKLGISGGSVDVTTGTFEVK